MSYIKLFRASNDTELSPPGTFTNALEYTLRADLEETDEVEIYAEADAGYSVSDVVASLLGTSASKFRMALTEAGLSSATWGANLNLGTVGAGAGGRVNFWVQARATDDEDPVQDDSVTVKVEGVAEAV